MSFVRFTRAAAFGVFDFFLPSQCRDLQDEDRLRANKRVFILLSREMEAIILDRGLLTIICNCGVDPVVFLLEFAQAHENDWSESEAAG